MSVRPADVGQAGGEIRKAMHRLLCWQVRKQLLDLMLEGCLLLQLMFASLLNCSKVRLHAVHHELVRTLAS